MAVAVLSLRLGGGVKIPRTLQVCLLGRLWGSALSSQSLTMSLLSPAAFAATVFLLSTCIADADTPHYSILAEVPYRIAEMHGQSARDGTFKYVVVLREPVARTISSWQFKYDREYQHFEVRSMS